MRSLILGAIMLSLAGAANAACPDVSLMQNAARGWIAGQRLPDPLVRTAQDASCAYASFRSVLETELGAPVGVKVGFTSRPVQERFGVTQPVSGRFSRRCWCPMARALASRAAARRFLRPIWS
ncbi:hypothetical protein ACFSS8_02485 [Paracoccus kondratievae]